MYCFKICYRLARLWLTTPDFEGGNLDTCIARGLKYVERLTWGVCGVANITPQAMNNSWDGVTEHNLKGPSLKVDLEL